MSPAPTAPSLHQRSARRAALRATHPDLGGSVEDFIAAVEAFASLPPRPRAAVAPARGSGATATPPTITSSRRSRAARRLRRTVRRVHPRRRYAHLI